MLAGPLVYLECTEIAYQIIAEIDDLYILENVQFDDGKFSELTSYFVIDLGLLLGCFA